MSPNSLMSMTAFASARGQGAGAQAAVTWAWDLRSVNGKGLDLRLRLPEGIEGLEAGLRAALGKALTRGNVSLGLRISRAGATEGQRLSPTGLQAALSNLHEIEAAARAMGFLLTPTSAADIHGLRGVLETGATDEQTPALSAETLLEDFAPLLAAFQAMRASEGAALGRVITQQLDGIEVLVEAARSAAAARRDKAKLDLQAAMARVLDSVEADPARIAQELALLAVKADITEEIDRLTAHIAAARALVAAGGPVGRKFDFLAQEFNREANTLCSKSGDIALTQVGLDLKHLIDQMREQVQNLE